MIIDLNDHADHPAVKAGLFKTRNKAELLGTATVPELVALRDLLEPYGKVAPRPTSFALAFVDSHLKEAMDSVTWIPSAADIQELYFIGEEPPQNFQAFVRHIQMVAGKVRDLYLGWFAPQ